MPDTENFILLHLLNAYREVPKTTSPSLEQVGMEIYSTAGTGKKQEEQLHKQMGTKFDRQLNKDAELLASLSIFSDVEHFICNESLNYL